MNFDVILDFFIYDPNKPLLFTQFTFWIFFLVLLIFYSFVYKKQNWRNIYLLIFSLFFYYKSGGYFFSLLVLSTFIDYWLGIKIFKSKSKAGKKKWLILSLISNLSLLFYFKYTYFLVDTFNQLSGSDYEVRNLLAIVSNSLTGSSFSIDKIILPVGISFYTFQTISYSIDMYRERLDKPVWSILDFGFYVTFFPQLVAGPIVRASEFIPQLYKDYKLTREEFGYAIFLILNGFIKKAVISDYISINYVDRIFESPTSYSGFENLMGIYGYAIQIYCDFSGYTDMAIGLAILLGFQLPFNFNSPYKSDSITDFWRRWHISLSSWLRDYLYISLGGNRKGKIRTYINLMLTMLLGGLWHGAHIKFIIWGGLHGAALGVHKIWMKYSPFGNNESWIYRAVAVFITFQFVNFTWIFFRAESLGDVGIILSQIFNNFGWAQIPAMLVSYKTVFSLMLFAYIVHWLPVVTKESYKKVFVDSPYYAKVLVAAAVVFVVFQFKMSDVQPFIYFQF